MWGANEWGLYKDSEIRIAKLIHPNKCKELSRGRVYVKNDDTGHLMSKSGHKISGVVSLFMNMCDLNMKVSQQQSDPGDRESSRTLVNFSLLI